MLYTNYMQELMGLKDVIVTSVERKDNQLNISLMMPRKIHKCPCCNNSTDKIHDYRIQRIKDIASFGSYTILYLRKRRYVCPLCKKRFYEEISFLPRYHRITSRLVVNILDSLRTVQSLKYVAKAANVSSTTATRIFDHIKYSNNSLPRVISMDEFKGNAGGEKFQCIITDPEHKKVLDILVNAAALCPAVDVVNCPYIDGIGVHM